MKKFLSISTLALLVFAHSALAAVVVTPTTGTTAALYDINCANDAHYYGLYNVSTLALQTQGECDATDLGLSAGNWHVVVSATSLSGVDYQNATVEESTTLQVTPDFATEGMAVNDISEGTFVNFLSGIGAFLVAQLPAVLATLAALIGLGFLLARVRRWIGRRA